MSRKVLRIKRKGVHMNSEVELYFCMYTFVTNGYEKTTAYANYKGEKENNFLQDNEVWLSFFERFEGLTHIKPQILEAISQMIENDIGDGSVQTEEIVVLPKEKLKPHSSCKMNQNVITNGLAKTEIGVCQSELKQKLSTLEKDSKVVKTFESIKCSVCLSNYKEILDEDLHIVVPSCGHPLCCKCADNVLDSEKKECPQCREKITAQSFNLVKFNADLKIDTENQMVFL